MFIPSHQQLSSIFCVLVQRLWGGIYYRLPPQDGLWGGNCRPCHIGVAAYEYATVTLLKENLCF